MILYLHGCLRPGKRMLIVKLEHLINTNVDNIRVSISVAVKRTYPSSGNPFPNSEAPTVVSFLFPTVEEVTGAALLGPGTMHIAGDPLLLCNELASFPTYRIFMTFGDTNNWLRTTIGYLTWMTQ